MRGFAFGGSVTCGNPNVQPLKRIRKINEYSNRKKTSFSALVISGVGK